MTVGRERLFDLISPIASDHGLELRTASFFGPKEFQATWKRSGDTIDVKISDYLIDAPDDVVRDFSSMIIGTIVNKKPAYGKAYLDWVRSDEYINGKRKIYLRRSRNLTGSMEGNERDLADSLDRLLDSGLLTPPNISNSFFSWTKIPNVRKVGFCSPMMRVVGVSSSLDDVSVPEFVLDYVVYHESLHLAQGYRPGQRSHDKKFRIDERRYPRYEEAESYLRSFWSGTK
ncbi:MAG: M48 family metallopeptidase [Methanomassiliicoccaceae archaeon]|nr:M48 family metallopeptidase [Methanomassiliicoccaceae archaeon]